MLTMLIAEHALKAFKPKSVIKEPDKFLKGIRFSPAEQEDDYLHITQQGADIICQNGSDFIVVQGDDRLTVSEKILEFSEMLADWKDDLEDMILHDCSLKPLIDRSVSVLQNPIMIIDDSNSIRAISNHGVGEVNSEWDYAVENGCFKIDVMRDVFNRPPYRKHPPRDMQKPFYLKPEGVVCGAINFRIPSEDDQSFIGSLLVYEGLTAIEPAMMQYVTILCNAIVVWFKVHSGKQPMYYSGKEVLTELLLSGNLNEGGEAILKNTIRDQNNHYVLIAVTGRNDTRIGPYIVYLEEKMPNNVFCMYHDILVVLTSANDGERHARLVEQTLLNEKPSIGISDVFSNLSTAPAFLKQAIIAMEYGGKAISKLSAEIMMSYIAYEAHKTIQNINIIHPALPILKEYDAKHKSDYYKTLFVYLITERSVTASLPILNIHRNTMTFRLERLNRLIEANLDDPAVREWLLLSYRLIGVPLKQDY